MWGGAEDNLHGAGSRWGVKSSINLRIGMNWLWLLCMQMCLLGPQM